VRANLAEQQQERLIPVSADRASTAVPTSHRRRRGSSRAPWILMIFAAVAFGYGLTTIPSAPASQFGLLAGASPLYGLSILLVAAAFGVAIRARNTSAATVAVVLMIVVQRLPRAVSTDAPMYAWTYKHLGVVDYIQTTGSLARGTDIYNGWPGLFVLTAWFSDVTGLAPVDIAHWFTPVFHLALAGLIFAAALAWRLSSHQALAAVFLVVTLNWVEQDYYSPQAMAILLTAGILLLLGLSRDRPVGVGLILILFAAVTITHQLTPFWVLLATGLLVVGKKLKPWWIVIPMAAMAIGFFFFNFDITQQYALFSANVVTNASTNDVGPGVLGQQVTSTVMRTLSLSMWLATAIALVWRWRRHQPVWALGVLAFSPLLILGGQNYGGEAVFRVFLYSLPGCSFVLAPILLAALRAGSRRSAAGFGLLLLATAMSAQCYFGSWFTNIVTPSAVAAADRVLSGSDYPAYVTPLLPVWPERSSANYVKYARYTDEYDHSLMFQEGLLHSHFDTDEEYEELMALVNSRTDAPTYLVLSPQMAVYGNYFGLFPFDAVSNLKRHLADDPRWNVVVNEPDVVVYVNRVPVK
jgi:hypothetical protein